MNNELTLENTTFASRSAEFLSGVVGVAGVMMLSAWVKIPLPFTPVPVTLQTLAVFLVGSLMPPVTASAGMLLYLVLGMAGAPIFAVSFGPTFGYIVGFVVAPFILAKSRNRVWGMPLALGLVYCLGVCWLSFWLGVSLQNALFLGVLPFAPADVFKMVVAHQILRSMQRSTV